MSHSVLVRVSRVLSLVASVVAIAVASDLRAQSENSVVETGRSVRQVFLTLRSGPHPYAGDYPVTVFLPPAYDADAARYPVIYIFDGYDFHAAHDTLCEENLIQPAILVAIGNKTGDSRMYDLTPSESPGYAYTGGLPGFAKLITDHLKPYVDGHFRTRTDAASTGVVGVSLGGLAACWLGYNQPEVFGLAGVLEPSLWWNNNDLLNHLQHDARPKFATRFWFMASDQEFPPMWQNAKYGAFALTQRGWREGEDVAFIQVHNYSHGSAAAYVQLRDMFYFLLGTEPAAVRSVALTNCHGPQLVPLRPDVLGGAAFAYLDVQHEFGVRTTAIAPPITVANPQVVSLIDETLGELVPAGAGWTTVIASYEGFTAVADVQGRSAGSAADPPARPSLPTITTQPVSDTVLPGAPAEFSVAAAAAGMLSYQWRRDGALLVAETSSTLSIGATSVSDAGKYEVIISSRLSGSTLSRPARLVVEPPNPGRLSNMSVRSITGHDGEPLIVGFVVADGPRRLLIRAAGPTLASLFQVAGAAADPRIDVHQSTAGIDAIVAANNDWGENERDGSALSDAFAAVGAFPLPQRSRDAALFVDLCGLYTVHAGATAGSAAGIVLIEGYDFGEGGAGRLVNVSARNWVGTGSDVLIAGFVVTGNVPKRLLIRGAGPTLATGFGIRAVLTDPKLELHERVRGRDTLFAANDNWADEPNSAQAFHDAMAFGFPNGSADAALVVTLPAGTYTAQLSGSGGETGEGLVEVYELPPLPRITSRLSAAHVP